MKIIEQPSASSSVILCNVEFRGVARKDITRPQKIWDLAFSIVKNAILRNTIMPPPPPGFTEIPPEETVWIQHWFWEIETMIPVLLVWDWNHIMAHEKIIWCLFPCINSVHIESCWSVQAWFIVLHASSEILHQNNIIRKVQLTSWFMKWRLIN